MKTKSIRMLLLLAVAGYAQAATLILTGPASAVPGQTITLTVTLSGSAGLNITGVQFGFQPATVIPVSAATVATLSTAGVTAGKGVYCGTGLCAEVGMSKAVPIVLSNNPLADGTLFTVPVTIPLAAPTGAIPISLLTPLAVNTAGVAVPMTVVGTTVTIAVSKCDVNGDGVVNLVDVAAIMTAIQTGTVCPGGLASCTVLQAVDVLIAALGGVCLF